MPARPLDHPANYLNRDASWLAFNRRVLEEAEDERNPLLERVKFLAISASNLDEFFEIRTASILQQIADGYSEPGPDGLSPHDIAMLIAEETHIVVDAQYRCWNERLLPELAAHGIRILGLNDVDLAARTFLEEYCEKELDPLLTPVTVDPAHPFPRVLNKALCQALLLRRRRRSTATYMGVITVPRALPRLIRLPKTGETDDYVFLADLVGFHAARMYRGYDIVSEAAFRITRNSNLYLAEEEARSLLESVRAELHNRHKGDAVRMEIEASANDEIIDRLRDNFALEPWQVFRTHGPVSLSRLMNIYELTDRPDLKFRPFSGREFSFSGTIFDELQRREVLLHHPFDSYNTVVRFIERAADDPQVLSIKQTLYRTGPESPILQALVRAAASKEVTVVLELKARFDEASNIRWARALEDAGVQVYHGLVGLKTHCKMTLVTRKEAGGELHRYAHLGTGNYNPTTAKLYTDLSLLTANAEMTAAVHDVFNFLTSYSEQSRYGPLLVSPRDLADRTLTLIAREAEHARAGRPARIVAKMNGLLDRTLIEELYRASQAGVDIDLIVRGMCALRPGVPHVSERIRVRSIVGRFLEHTRIFWFANGGDDEVYAGSADWMPRNLYERVEVIFPVRDAALRARLTDEVLGAYLADTAKARLLRRDGRYARVSKARAGRDAFSAQEFLMEVAEGKAPKLAERRAARTRSKARTVTEA